TWTLEVYVKPTAPAGKTVDLPIKIRAQVCAKQCFQEDYELTVPVAVSSEPPLEPTADLRKRLAVKQPAPEVGPYPKERGIPTEARATPAPGKKDAGTTGSPGPGKGKGKVDSGLIASILQAIIGGFVALLTPCVFPMIPITVSFFLKQAEKRKSSPAPALSGG